MKTKKIASGIYEIEKAGTVYTIDGQNGGGWNLFINGEWDRTLPTKKDCIEFVSNK